MGYGKNRYLGKFESEVDYIMATYTTNYNLVKPDLNETADIEVINDNTDIIDTQLKTCGKFKKGSAIYTDNDTSQTFTNTFCTANSLVTIIITTGTPQGIWTVNSADGSFTITSDVAESADISFDYYIQKEG